MTATSIAPTIHSVLQAIFGGCDGVLNLRACGTGGTTSLFYALDDATGLRAFLNHHAAHRDCYVSMATYQDDANATADNARHLPSLFADLDFGDSSEAAARRRLQTFVHPPSVVWHSGGGLHSLWLLKEPIDLQVPDEVQRAASLLRRLAVQIGADLSAAEPNRVLRVVKTFNHKPHFTPAKRVELETFEPTHTYNLDDFDLVLAAETTATLPTQKVTIPEHVTKGTRHRLLFRQGRSLKRQGLIPGAIWAALDTTNRMCCTPPLPEAEVKKIAASVMKTKDRKGFKVAETPLLDTTTTPETSLVLEMGGQIQDAPEHTGEAADIPSAPTAAPVPADSTETPAPQVEVIDLAVLLDETARYFRRFVVVDPDQATTLALYVAHTYTFLSADITPYLSITSATKRAGKSLLLDCLARVVASPWKTSRVSPAALLRKVDKIRPTLLLDEVDQALRTRGSDFAEALIGLLNAGFAKDGVASLCQGDAHEVTDFHVYCPKVLCGIGALPDTVLDRAIVIRLRRRMRTERTERGRLQAIRGAGLPLQRRWSAWGVQVLPRLTKLGAASLPEALDDRQQDCWEALLTIAELAGDLWSGRARAAAVALSVGREDEDHAVQLLADIHSVMESSVVSDPRGKPFDIIVSTALLGQLNKLTESPWATWTRGGEMSAHAMAALLKGFEIRSRKHRVGDTTKRGYTRPELSGVFARYLPAPLETPEQAVRAEQTNQDGGKSVPLRNSVPLRSGTAASPPSNHHAGPAESVPEQNGEAEQKRSIEPASDPLVPDVPDFTRWGADPTRLH